MTFVVWALCTLCWLGSMALCARADVGLIVETPTGTLGFLSDVGHSSVWISRGCLSAAGEIRFCEDSPGIVLTSTAYWPNPGAAAIPAELFFLGSRPGVAGRNSAAWTQSLSAAYPNVNPEFGRKYLGRAWRRSMRVTTFKTSPEDDRRVLAQIEQQRKTYRYSYSHRNCAFYAQQILRLYLGNDFHANRVLDLGIETPRALERALEHRLATDPNASFRVISFKGTLLQDWRQPPRTFCETAIFDPKYAIPLIMFQPYIYVGFGVCYGVTRLVASSWKSHRHPGFDTAAQASTFLGATAARTDFRVITYQRLTGSLPASSQWLSFAPMEPSSSLRAAPAPSSPPAL